MAIKVLSLRHLQERSNSSSGTKTLAQLDHPAIPKYIDFFQTSIDDAGNIYLVDFGAVRDSYHQTITGGSTLKVATRHEITIDSQNLAIDKFLGSKNVYHKTIPIEAIEMPANDR